MLWISVEGSFAVTDEPLTSCPYVAYRNGFFRGLRFLDAAGDSWVVSEVIFERPPNIFDRLPNRKLRVELRLPGPEKRPLSEIAELLCACVDWDPGDIYTQFVDPEELKSLFRSARSVHELLHHARTLGADIEIG
jgi:hypothetical protein